MSVIKASLSGYCFGVKRAIDTVEEVIKNKEENEQIYTLGMIIHNRDVVNDFTKRGVSVIETSALPSLFESCSPLSKVTVITRAHGIESSVKALLDSYTNADENFRVIDCTCPFVRKIHTIALDETNENTVFFIFGNPDHPETRAIISYVKGKKYIISSSSEAEELFNRIDFSTYSPILASQTTMKLSEWEKIQHFFKNHCTNGKIFDTICIVTENRQKEALALAKEVELMVVIGSRESSNTYSLYESVKKVLDNSVIIENAGELKSVNIKIPDHIGITAGASTPAHIIEEVFKTMSEVQETKIETASFAEMLEDSLKTLNTGDVVTGVITSISSTEVHVDLSAKVTGIIAVDELISDSTQNINDLYKVGDSIEAFVVRVSDVEGVAGLSRRRIERMSDWKKINEAYADSTVLEGKVTEAIKGGVIISTGFTKVFVPASQTGLPKDAELSSLLGTTQKFVVIDINDQRNRAVASIKSVLRAERRAQVEEFWANIEEGKKYEGTVKSLTSFGAFVDLGGVDGMVHVSELSWNRIKDPSEVVKVGDSINVFVKSFDREKKRISLGCKTAENNPWNIFMNTFKVGDIAPVKIVGITPFGAFAEITPNVDGLIHISQIADKKIGNPAEYLSIDQVVEAKIIAIDEEKKKVSLSIRALLSNDESEEESVQEETAVED